MRRTRGFTLVELMVVVVILSIVIAMGSLMYGRAVRGDEAPGFVRAVVAMVNQARQVSVSSGKYVRIALVPGSPTLLYAQEQDPTQAAISTDLTKLAAWIDLGGHLQAPHDVEICAPDATATPGASAPASCPATAAVSVCFAPDGSVTVGNQTTCPGNLSATSYSGATLYVRTSDDAKHYKIYLFGLTGMPRMTDQW